MFKQIQLSILPRRNFAIGLLIFFIAQISIYGENPNDKMVHSELKWNTHYYTPNGSYTSVSQVDRNKEGDYILSEISTLFLLNARLKSTFEVMEFNNINSNESLIESTGFKSIQLIKSSPDQYQIDTSNKQGKKKSSTKKISNAMDFSTLRILIHSQYKNLNPQKSNNGKPRVLSMFDPPSGRSYELELNIFSVNPNGIKTICPQYSFPPSLLSALSTKKPMILIEGKMTGIAGKFYKHKFYFLLDPDNNCRLVMDWGGDPKKPYYALHSY